MSVSHSPIWFSTTPGSLHIPGIHRVLFHEKNGLEGLHPSDDSFTRTLAVRFYAQAFYQATVQQKGTDETRLKEILQQVAQKNALPEFNREIARIAKQDKKPYRNARHIIEREYARNPFKAFFKSATRKELLDYLETGKNHFRPSGWEYRKLGMWNAVADFVAVCRQYPVMSSCVIGAVAWLGHKFPFAGGVSGIAIIAWGTVASAIHELKALASPKQSEARAEHHIKSGENMAAALITSLGYKGIRNGTINGLEHAREKVGVMSEASAVKKAASGMWTAVKATSKEQHKTTPLESFLFVSGLFDNVSLPFNWAADKLGLHR